jgi:hypothetical protein
MNRWITLAVLALLACTWPLARLVARDLERARGREAQAEAVYDPKTFEGRALGGGAYRLAEQADGSRAVLFVLHERDVQRELALWRGVQPRLRAAGVALVAACDTARCAEGVRALGTPPFTVLEGLPFVHARSLARLDDEGSLLVCSRLGRVLARYPLPRDPAEADGLVSSLLLLPEAGHGVS